jgi:protein-disulfide isomerase
MGSAATPEGGSGTRHACAARGSKHWEVTMAPANVLAVPVSPRDHSRGRPDAQVTLVEYGDFECPDSGQAYYTIARLCELFGPCLRLICRHFPLTNIHPHAALAAEAAEAAAAQSEFWQMHDTLYQHQDQLSTDDLLLYAATMGLDIEPFATALYDRTYRAQVAADRWGARCSAVHGTPSFFLNGFRYEGPRDFSSLFAIIDRLAHETDVPVYGASER